VHLVTVKNFNTPVSVRLEFLQVSVLPEGASAQFAITDKGEALSKAPSRPNEAQTATPPACAAGCTARRPPRAESHQANDDAPIGLAGPLTERFTNTKNRAVMKWTPVTISAAQTVT
jgi:hypothetical protein